MFLLSSILFLICAQEALSGGCNFQTFNGEVKCDTSGQCDNICIRCNNCEKFECDDDTACENSEFSISAIEDFELLCKGDEACSGSTTEMSCPSGEEIEGVLCDGRRSCFERDVTITGSCDADEYNCDGFQACKFGSVSSEAKFEKFLCKEPEACSSMESVEFVADEEVEILCDGEKACMGTSFAVSGGSDDKIKKIECKGDQACMGTTFSFELNSAPETVDCQGEDACKDCTVSWGSGPTTKTCQELSDDN